MLCHITGIVKSSSGTPITGQMLVQLNATVIDIDTAPKTIYSPRQDEIDIVGGAVDLHLPETETSGIRYRFTVQTLATQNTFYSGTDIYSGPTHQEADTLWYTGAATNANQQTLSVQSTIVPTVLISGEAIIPRLAEIDFADLDLFPTGITYDTSLSGAIRVADLLANDETYRSLLKGGPRYQGTFNKANFYKKDDICFYAGSSWMSVADYPHAGNYPNLNSAFWSPLSLRGEPGGTGGSDDAFSATGWLGNLDAPSKNTIALLYQQLATKSYTDSAIANNQAASPTVKVLKQDLTAASPAATDLFTLPEHGIVTQLSIQVTQAFNGSPLLSIGTDAQHGACVNNFNLATAIVDLYDFEPVFISTASTAIRAFFSPGGATQGQLSIYAQYAIPSSASVIQVVQNYDASAWMNDTTYASKAAIAQWGETLATKNYVASFLQSSEPFQVLKGTINFTSPANNDLGQIVAGSRIKEIQVVVDQPFAPGSTLAIGTSSALYMQSAHCDLAIADKFTVEPDVLISTTDRLVGFFSKVAGSTVGSVSIVVTVVC